MLGDRLGYLGLFSGFTIYATCLHLFTTWGLPALHPVHAAIGPSHLHHMIEYLNERRSHSISISIEAGDMARTQEFRVTHFCCNFLFK